MAFLESPSFPPEISAWLVGGGGFNTIIAQTYGGDEYRNQQWAYELGEWDIAEALRVIDGNASTALAALAYQGLRNLFKVSRGMWGGFRVKIFDDYQDEGHGVLGATGLAVASTLAYQMFKNYASGSGTYQRKIAKPVVGATKVYNNGVLQLLTTDYTIDESLGLVTFTSQPTVGHALTWTGQFDTPCRFGGDLPKNGLDTSGGAYNWQGLKLVELRNP